LLDLHVIAEVAAGDRGNLRVGEKDGDVVASPPPYCFTEPVLSDKRFFSFPTEGSE
jgi:hypothetical protein